MNSFQFVMFLEEYIAKKGQKKLIKKHPEQS